MYPMGLNPPNILLRLKWPFRASGFTPIQTPQVWRKENPRDVGGETRAPARHPGRIFDVIYTYLIKAVLSLRSFFLHFNKKDPGLFLFVVWKKNPTSFWRILRIISKDSCEIPRDPDQNAFFGDEAPNRNKDLESVSFSMGIRESQGPFEPSPENFPQISCWMSWYNSEMEWQTSLADVSSGWVDHMSPDFIIFCDRKTASGIRDVQNNVDVRPYKSLAILQRNCLSTFQTSC